jgi:predicted DNA-binding antitoxin AbrB/MazE fold protein
MKHSLEAVYENGIFRPLKTPAIPDGQQVLLEVEPVDEKSETSPLELATLVYRGLSESEIDEVEKIALDRQDFFSEEPP